MPMPAIALHLATAPSLSARPSLKLVPPLCPCLTEMFRNHHAFVQRNLRRLGVASSSVEDAAQEVFIVAQRHLDKFRPGSSERAWLSAIALRVASDYRRAAKRRSVLPMDEITPVSRESSPLDRAMYREALERANDALASLSDVQRAVFLLADVEELTAPEIAALTGTKLATVYTRILAARKRFGEALSERDGQLDTQG